MSLRLLLVVPVLFFAAGNTLADPITNETTRFSFLVSISGLIDNTYTETIPRVLNLHPATIRDYEYDLRFS